MRMNLKLPANGKRLIHDLTSFGMPEVPYVAAQNLPFTTLALPTHIHRHRMEINHILKGERVYRVGGKDYLLRGNEVFVTWPDEVHGSGSALHGRGLHFWMQIVLPKPGAAFLGLSPKRAEPLVRALRHLPQRHFRANAELRGLYAKILHLCRAGPSPLGKVRMSALVTEWLLEVIACADEAVENRVSPDIARVVAFLDRDLAEHYSVEQLAEMACLSESHFKRKFREQVGIPPGDYLQRRRLESAVRMLSRGRNVTSVAYDLGFSSSQHFSTTFKKFFGVSPLSWLRKTAVENAAQNREQGKAGGKDASGLKPWVDEDGRLHGHICPEPDRS